MEALDEYKKAAASFGEEPRNHDRMLKTLEEALVTEAEAKLLAGFMDRTLSKVALRKYVQGKMRVLTEAGIQDMLDPRIQARVKAALLLK